VQKASIREAATKRMDTAAKLRTTLQQYSDAIDRAVAGFAAKASRPQKAAHPPAPHGPRPPPPVVPSKGLLAARQEVVEVPPSASSEAERLCEGKIEEVYKSRKGISQEVLTEAASIAERAASFLAGGSTLENDSQKKPGEDERTGRARLAAHRKESLTSRHVRVAQLAETAQASLQEVSAMGTRSAEDEFFLREVDSRVSWLMAKNESLANAGTLLEGVLNGFQQEKFFIFLELEEQANRCTLIADTKATLMSELHQCQLQ
jgi:hypothetical protein